MAQSAAAQAGKPTPGCAMCELVERQCNFCKAAKTKEVEDAKKAQELGISLAGGGSGGAMAVDRNISRPIETGGNRIQGIGIHTIEIYTPQFFTEQAELEVFDSSPDRFGPGVIGKYTKGIGQTEFRYATDDEDPISFGMTVIHRLIDRIGRESFNQTWRYSENGEPLPLWNAFGCFNVGTESIIDRSKSMKSYIMDLFERYGNESNIEGVDHYNACYGGQAAFFNVMNWMESNRWDGRYGVSVATDYSDAEGLVRFGLGAGATATLVYPDAPLVHYGTRATCILHRFDFFKPVGWHSMAPIVDGKYSIEVYMNAIDVCTAKMQEKQGVGDLTTIGDYNVFHTGGGFHVVRKAFDRYLRAQQGRGTISQQVRQEEFDNRCAPSTHIMKIVGPCHTVSSFMNIYSVANSQRERGFGKTIIVFTYGSGATASMYKLRIEDFMWATAIERWKLDFYRLAIKTEPALMVKLSDEYTNTWMKFNFKPEGRKKHGISVHTFEWDVYYLMEIDGWGRRFYHRGGIKAPPLDEEDMLQADLSEQRPMRDHWGEMPELEPEVDIPLEQKWRNIEYEMTYEEPEVPEYEVIEESYDKDHPENKFFVIKDKEGIVKKPQGKTIDNDGLPHTYQVVGTWSKRKVPEQMTEEKDGSFTFVITLGENCWEQFHLIQDNDMNKKIYPAFEKSWKGMPMVGPHHGGQGLYWHLDGRPLKTVPDMDYGKPGDKYKVTFSWPKKGVKDLVWDKLDDASTTAGDSPVSSIPNTPRGKYFIFGSWSCFKMEELKADPRKEGLFTFELQITSLGAQFNIMRDEDWEQIFYPDVEQGECGTMGSVMTGPDEAGVDKFWEIEGAELGDVFQVDFYRNPQDYTTMRVTWNKIGHKDPVEPEPRFFYVGNCNDWDARYDTMEMKKTGDDEWTVEVECYGETEEFQIVMNKQWSKTIHPDKEQCTQLVKHAVLIDGKGDELNWAIGKAKADKYKPQNGDIYKVKLTKKDDGYEVSWEKFKEGKAFSGLKRGFAT